VYNHDGEVDVIADVVGWLPASNGYQPLTPNRVLDTRSGLNIAPRKLGPGRTLRLTIAGRGGVPFVGAEAVAINLTAARPTVPSYLTVWPANAERPNASNLNLAPDRAVANLVITKLSADGAIDLYNAFGETDVVIDALGWFPAGTGYHPLQPARILDTRAGIGARSRLRPHSAIDVDCLCRGGVPANASAIVINVTVAEPDAAGYVSIWPTGEPQPNTSSVNFAAGDVVPNLAITRVGIDGLITIYNAFGNTHCIADVVGWFD